MRFLGFVCSKAEEVIMKRECCARCACSLLLMILRLGLLRFTLGSD